MRISQISKVLGILTKHDVVPLFWGEHGIGKTESVKQYAKDTGQECIVLNLGNMQDPGDFLGIYNFMKGPNGEDLVKYARPNWLPDDPNSHGILFLDEVNRARRDMLQAIFSLVLEKRIHQYHLPKGWHVVAAANPASDDYIVTDTEDQAFLSRFCNIPVYGDIEEWCEYAQKQGVDGSIVSFVKEHGKMFNNSKDNFSLSNLKPSLRNAQRLDAIVKERPEMNLLNEIVFGLLGSTAGTQYLKHLEEYQTYIKGSDVMDNWTATKKRIQKIVKENKRLDTLTSTNDEVLALVENKTLTKTEYNTVVDYMISSPVDLGYAFLKKLVASDKFILNNKQILEDKDIITHFKAAGIKNKEAEKESKEAK